jgi:hypothetical protein
MSPYPNRDVCVAIRGCPLNVDTSRLVSANNGHSPTHGNKPDSTLNRGSRCLWKLSG